MLSTIIERFKQGYRTNSFPETAPPLPEHFAGIQHFNQGCPEDCRQCLEACPQNCIKKDSGKLSIDNGDCIFCRKCADACSSKNIKFSGHYQFSADKRNDFINHGSGIKIAKGLEAPLQKLYGKSLKLRQVSAGGCNACELDLNVLNTLAWDLGRFGIQYVASPRHADGLIVTGPVSKNMELALKKAYDALPEPKIVIAAGTCAVSGGIYKEHEECCGGVAKIIPVNMYICGCPPHPLSFLDGLLRLIGRIEEGK